MGVKNDSFWSEIGSGFAEPGGTPPNQEFPGVPPGASGKMKRLLCSDWLLLERQCGPLLPCENYPFCCTKEKKYFLAT